MIVNLRLGVDEVTLKKSVIVLLTLILTSWFNFNWIVLFEL